MNQKTIAQLLVDAQDIDRDIKIIAMNDLCDRLLQRNIQPADQKSIITIMIGHLTDHAVEVQGNSIRVITKTIKYIEKGLVREILDILMTKIVVKTQVKQNECIINLFATCIQTVIKNVDADFADIACAVVLPIGINGLQAQSQHLSTVEVLIDIINCVFEKFSVYLLKEPAFHDPIQKLVDLLLALVTHDNTPVRKKACNCLGSISTILSIESLTGLAKFFERVLSQPGLQPSVQLLHLQALYQVSKNVAGKMLPTDNQPSPLLKFLVDAVTKQQKVQTSSEDLDHQNLHNELCECLLQTVENFVRNSSDTIKNVSRQILDFALQLIDYDPHNEANKCEEMEEEEEEENEYEDDEDNYAQDEVSDDTSWRVRRSAVSIIDTFLQVHKQLLEDISDKAVPILIRRLKDTEENVRKATVDALKSYFHAIVYESDVDTKQQHEDSSMHDDMQPLCLRRVKSKAKNYDDNTKSLVTAILKLLVNAIKKKSQADDRMKMQMTQLLLTGSFYIPQQLFRQWRDIQRVVTQYFEQSSDKRQNQEICINLLTVLRRILKPSYFSKGATFEISDENMKAFLKIATNAVSCDYFKLTSEGFKYLGDLFFLMRFFADDHFGVPAVFQSTINPNLNLLLGKLNQSDLDYEVKLAVVNAAAKLLNTWGDQLPAQFWAQTLQALSMKLKNDMTRMSILNVLIKLLHHEKGDRGEIVKHSSSSSQKMEIEAPITSKASSLPNDSAVTAVGVEITIELTGLLKKAQRTVQVATIGSLQNMLKLLQNNIPQTVLQGIIENGQKFIKDEDFNLAELAVSLLSDVCKQAMNLNQPQIIKSSMLSDSTLKLIKSEIIPDNILQSLIKFVLDLVSWQILEPQACIAQLLADIKRTQISAISKCIGQLCLHNLSLSDVFFDNIINPEKFLSQWAAQQQQSDMKQTQPPFQQQQQQLQQTQQVTVNQPQSSLSSQFDPLNHLMLSLSIIKEIGKHQDLSNQEKLISHILSFFNHDSEDLKEYASQALGGVVSGNQSKLLFRYVIEPIQNQQENQNLYLNSLQEVIQNSTVITKPLVDIVPNLFVMSGGSTTQESFRNMVAECIGKICLHAVDQVRNSIIENLRSENPNIRYTAAHTFKFFCVKSVSENKLQSLIDSLFPMVMGETEMAVKRVVLTSVTQIAYSHPHIFNRQSPEFFRAMFEATRFDEKSIIVIELLTFKQRQDHGLGLRKTAFQFMEKAADTLFEYVKLDLHLFKLGLMNGFSDESEDIQLITFDTIHKLCQHQIFVIYSLIDDVLVEQYKKYIQNRGRVDGERVSDTMHAALRSLVSISKIQDIAQKSVLFAQFFQDLQRDPKLNDIIRQLSE